MLLIYYFRKYDLILFSCPIFFFFLSVQNELRKIIFLFFSVEKQEVKDDFSYFFIHLFFIIFLLDTLADKKNVAK